MVETPKPAVRCSDPSHAAFNASRKTTPTPNPFDGPWLKTDTLTRLPNLVRDFQIKRDPLIAKQVHDLEGREEGSGDGSMARAQDKPKPELKPPAHMRGGSGAGRDDQWLAAQHAVAIKSVPQARQQPRTLDLSHQIKHSRGRTPRP